MNNTSYTGTKIAIASGKGGVGKTTLALALAYELSVAGNNVVLIDIDLSNRGLSELCTNSFFNFSKTKSDLPVIVNESGIERLDVTYFSMTPNLTVATLNRLSMDQLTAADSLSPKIVQNVIQNIPAFSKIKHNVIIYDCRGGRDVFSQVACTISDHVIIVSSDDKATFFGTTIFAKGLSEKLAKNNQNDTKIHLVFNRISNNVRNATLSYWYEKYFNQYCDNSEILAIFPIEPNVSISASNQLFPTRKFVYSKMADKCRLIAFSLFENEENVIVAPESLFIGRWMSIFIKSNRSIFSLFLGIRVPAGLVIIALLMFYLFTMSSKFFDTSEIILAFGNVQKIGLVFASLGVFLAVAITWFLGAFLLRSIDDLDLMITGDLNGFSRRWIFGILWRIPILILGMSVFSIFFRSAKFDVSPDYFMLVQATIRPIIGREVAKFEEVLSLFHIFNVSVLFLLGFVLGLILLQRLFRAGVFRAYSLEFMYRVLTVFFVVMITVH